MPFPALSFLGSLFRGGLLFGGGGGGGLFWGGGLLFGGGGGGGLFWGGGLLFGGGGGGGLFWGGGLLFGGGGSLSRIPITFPASLDFPVFAIADRLGFTSLLLPASPVLSFFLSFIRSLFLLFVSGSAGNL